MLRREPLREVATDGGPGTSRVARLAEADRSQPELAGVGRGDLEVVVVEALVVAGGVCGDVPVTLVVSCVGCAVARGGVAPARAPIGAVVNARLAVVACFALGKYAGVDEVGVERRHGQLSAPVFSLGELSRSVPAVVERVATGPSVVGA